MHLQLEAEYLYFPKQIASDLLLPKFQDRRMRCLVQFEIDV